VAFSDAEEEVGLTVLKKRMEPSAPGGLASTERSNVFTKRDAEQAACNFSARFCSNKDMGRESLENQ
jgi:hypothetical protein